MASTLQSSPSDGREDAPLDVLWEDGERLYRRMWRDMGDRGRRECLVARPRSEHPTPATVSRLAHEYGLREYLDHPWALRPLELVREHGHTILVFESTKARPLDQIIGPGAPVETFLAAGDRVLVKASRRLQLDLLVEDLDSHFAAVSAGRGHPRSVHDLGGNGA